MKNANIKGLGGFTLIELLVVVLIIGILSSVALPQYQVSVSKSRLSALIPTVRALKDGMEMYYLANGAYPPDQEGSFGFDLEIGQGCSGADGTLWITCPNNIYYDRLDHGALTVSGVNLNIKLAYLIWLDHSSSPNQIRCIAAANDANANKVCKSMGGTLVSGESYTAIGSKLGNINSYRI